MLPNRIVVRFADGRMMKGTTQDFAPTKDAFHVIASDGGARPIKVALADLKAVFFVKDLMGNPDHHEARQFSGPAPGRKLEVAFHDGEILVGTTQAYQPGRPGFFLVPADRESNNERIYVVSTAVKDVRLLT